MYIYITLLNQGPFKENIHLFLESSAAPSSANDLLMGSKTWTNFSKHTGLWQPQSDTVGQTSTQTTWDGETYSKSMKDLL